MTFATLIILLRRSVIRQQKLWWFSGICSRTKPTQKRGMWTSFRESGHEAGWHEAGWQCHDRYATQTRCHVRFETCLGQKTDSQGMGLPNSTAASIPNKDWESGNYLWRSHHWFKCNKVSWRYPYSHELTTMLVVLFTANFRVSLKRDGLDLRNLYRV